MSADHRDPRVHACSGELGTRPNRWGDRFHLVAGYPSPNGSSLSRSDQLNPAVSAKHSHEGSGASVGRQKLEDQERVI
jgi:hypothetical protein